MFTTGAFGIECHVQIRTPAETMTITSQGLASPLEESVIDLSQNIDKIFSFGNRLILNYGSVSLLIPNMPITDDPLCGRIRDHGAIIAESADLAVENINLHIDSINNADQLIGLADNIAETVKGLRGSYKEIQVGIGQELNNMADVLDDMYIHLGLTSSQEVTVSKIVRDAVERSLILIERSSDLDKNFVGIVESLKKADKYKVIQQENPILPSVELW